MSLMAKLKKNSTIEDTDILSQSEVFNDKDVISTSVPMINVALSGDLDGGFSPGLTLWCGPSKHFKSLFSLLMAKAYMDKYPDAVLLFYDSEFGTPKAYFESFNIDMNRVLHTPITNIEKFKFDIMSQLEQIERNDHVIILVDSVGNLASKKEVDDAMNQNQAADMTRAKQLKSVFRMITPYLTLKDIPMIVVNHIYMTQEMFSKPVVSGGCLIEGTEIQTVAGPKKIEEITKGEHVITLVGPKEVSNIWNPTTLAEGTPECYEITFEDGTSVICSDSHEFLIDGEWVEAKDLKIDMDCTVI